MKKTLLIAAALALGACANNQTMYHWGGYQPAVYSYMKAPDGDHASEILTMEQTQEEAKAKNKQLPPGFYAHLGMLYSAGGKLDLAQQAFTTEKTLYPESSKYMDFVLSKFSKGNKK